MSGRGPFRTLLKYELLQVVRDRRTLMIAVVAPLLLYPLLLFLSRWSEERQERTIQAAVYHYAVTGPAAAWARGVVRRAADLPPEGGGGAQRLEERTVQEPDSALAAGRLDLVVAALEPDTLPVPLLVLRYRSGSDFSQAARQAMDARLRRLRDERRSEAFARRGFPVALGDVGRVDTRDVASASEEGGALLAEVLTPLLVLLMIGGGGVVASDAISGEKERGTLETLLTTAVSRRQIVWSKLLSIVAVAMAVVAVNVLNLLVYLVLGLIHVPARYAVRPPPGTLGLLVVLYLPVALLLASILLLLSGYAKSYKEYQIYALPATFLFLIPSLAAALPGIALHSVIAAVPLAGISVAVREVLTGEFDWPFLGLAFASTAAAAAWAARATAATLSRERLITSAELELADLVGGEPLFRRNVLRWYGVLWVLLLLVSLWFEGRMGIRSQVVVNLVVLFLGASILMIRRYRLDPRKALALRAPPAAAWLAVVIGVPSAQIAGIAVSRLAQHLFPVPERMVEAFGQYLLPQGMPIWQVLLFLCVLPGICEEIAFRGLLLHGLRKKLRPIPLALVVGAIFGLFHVELFRILPVAYLGAVLAAVVLLTGSIFPAMAWHALNNAFALLAAWKSVPLDRSPPTVIAAGVGGLCVSAWILWRSRRPYPGLRGGPDEKEAASGASKPERPLGPEG